MRINEELINVRATKEGRSRTNPWTFLSVWLKRDSRLELPLLLPPAISLRPPAPSPLFMGSLAAPLRPSPLLFHLFSTEEVRTVKPALRFGFLVDFQIQILTVRLVDIFGPLYHVLFLFIYLFWWSCKQLFAWLMIWW